VSEKESEKQSNDERDALLHALAKGSPAEEETPSEYQYLDEKRIVAELKILQDHAKQDIELREKYAAWLLIMLAIELAVVNVIFVAYAWAGERWHLPEGVIQIWLGATFVQVVGVVTVVTKYLFPRRDQAPELAGGLAARARAVK
jgi:uncharacterized integral membrane protein